MPVWDRPSEGSADDDGVRGERGPLEGGDGARVRADAAALAERVDHTLRPDIDRWDRPPPPLEPSTEVAGEQANGEEAAGLQESLVGDEDDQRGEQPTEDDATVLQGPLLDRLEDLMGLGDRACEGEQISERVDRPDLIPGKPFTYAEVRNVGDDGVPRRPPLFDGQPKRDDVRQGEIGDCWLMSPLGAVAGHMPERIAKIVEEQSDGTYQVTLAAAKMDPVTRDWKPTKKEIHLSVTPELVVDPAQPHRSVFADTGQSGVTWPAVLEKAFAGVDQTWDDSRRRSVATQGYHRLDEGGRLDDTAEVLALLTGRRAGVMEFTPGITRDHDAAQLLKRQLDRGHPVIVGTRNAGPGQRLPFKLEPGHAYEVVGIERGLVSLRNPWGDRHPQRMRVRDLLDNIDQRFATTKD